LTVFYHRSDTLSDEQKDKIVYFRNYDDEGRWYVLLNEAHKGDVVQQHLGWTHKIEGYRRVFEEGGAARVFSHGQSRVRVYAFFHTSNLAQVPDAYRRYWFDNFEKMFDAA
jgi:hypothetical protein